MAVTRDEIWWVHGKLAKTANELNELAVKSESESDKKKFLRMSVEIEKIMYQLVY